MLFFPLAAPAPSTSVMMARTPASASGKLPLLFAFNLNSQCNVTLEEILVHMFITILQSIQDGRGGQRYHVGHGQNL